MNIKSLIIGIVIGYTLIATIVLILAFHADGIENWNNHIDEIQVKNLATDAEISCIMYKHGFGHMGLFDDPTYLDYLRSGLKNVPLYCSTCIDIQR